MIGSRKVPAPLLALTIAIAIAATAVAAATTPVTAAANLSAAEGATQSVTTGAARQLFVGSSPCGSPVRERLRIASSEACELIEWQVTLHRDPRTATPTRYELQSDYGPVEQGQPGLGRSAKSATRSGTWTIAKGRQGDPDATVYELDGAISLLAVDEGVLHLLDGNGYLLVGNGGWSYALNRDDLAESPPRRRLWRAPPERAYPITELAAGPDVFGVFEGRSPCQRIADQLGVPVEPQCGKAKWRLTLLRQGDGTPGRYKVEGSLQLAGPREGSWSVLRGIPEDPDAVVYRLAPSTSASALLLLVGDENVLFFLDERLRPLVGSAQFSYVLNRRQVPERQPSAG